MKKRNILFLLSIVFSASYGQITDQKFKESFQDKAINGLYGDAFEASGVFSDAEMHTKYRSMAINDSLPIKFSGRVVEVCQAKGCWMTLELDNDAVAMVRFKDYGFFVPKDISGREVVINGLAFVEEMSVEDQKHYAKDGGLSKAEIEKITEPKKKYSFEASGVLLKD